MKTTRKCLALVAGVLSATSAWSAITINFSGVAFLDNSGAALPDGALIQIIASTQDAGFAAPTPSAFVSGDDIVIASFTVDSSTSGVPGGVVAALNIADYTTYSASFNLNDPLTIRWYPSLVAGSATPGATTYGEFREALAGDGSDMSWAAPADGGNTYALNLISTDFGGSVAPSALRATLVTAVPEPSSFAALAGFAVLGLAASRRRRA